MNVEDICNGIFKAVIENFRIHLEYSWIWMQTGKGDLNGEDACGRFYVSVYGISYPVVVAKCDEWSPNEKKCVAEGLKRKK